MVRPHWNVGRRRAPRAKRISASFLFQAVAMMASATRGFDGSYWLVSISDQADDFTFSPGALFAPFRFGTRPQAAAW
jgi:hypothetical protein